MVTGVTAMPPVVDGREETIAEEVRALLLRQAQAGRAAAASDGEGDMPATEDAVTAETAEVERLIRSRVAAAQRRASELGETPLADPEGIVRRLLAELVGFGPLQPLLDSPSTEEIIVNGPRHVFVIAEGEKTLTDVTFRSDDELLHFVRRAVGRAGRQLTETNPMVDAQLPDGSRLNAVIPPLVPKDTHVTIRRFLDRARTLDDLVALKTLTPEAADFLAACVRARLNLLISGGTASGKTTLVKVLASSIPEAMTERLITIEGVPELRLELPDCVALLSRPAGAEGSGEVAVRDLVRNALRMRPTRIIVGEVRGGEALDMLSAMNSGHEGSMCTLHADSPREALRKLGMYVLMADDHPDSKGILASIEDAIDIVVQIVQRPRSAQRSVTSIFEVTGKEDDQLTGMELFSTVDGVLRWSGIAPRRAEQLAEAGYVPPGWGGGR